MNSLLASLITFFVMPLIGLILFVIFAYVILSWLFTLNIVDPRNPTARQVYGILSSVVDPIVTPFRKFIPPLGVFDMGFFVAAMSLFWIYNWMLPTIVNFLMKAG